MRAIRRPPVQDHAPSLDRLGDVLDPLLAHRREGELEPLAQLLAHLAGDADPARLGQALQPRGDVHAVAVDVPVGLVDDVAQVDADPEADALVLGHRRLALGHALLDRDRAGDRIDDAGELDKAAVAHELDDAAVVLGDERLDELLAVRLEPLERTGPRRAP